MLAVVVVYSRRMGAMRAGRRNTAFCLTSRPLDPFDGPSHGASPGIQWLMSSLGRSVCILLALLGASAAASADDC